MSLIIKNNSILIYSFIEMSHYQFISFFIVRFVIILASCLHKKNYKLIKIQHNHQFIIKWMKNAKTNTNFMTKNLQIDMAGI